LNHTRRGVPFIFHPFVFTGTSASGVTGLRGFRWLGRARVNSSTGRVISRDAASAEGKPGHPAAMNRGTADRVDCHIDRIKSIMYLIF